MFYTFAKIIKRFFVRSSESNDCCHTCVTYSLSNVIKSEFKKKKKKSIKIFKSKQVRNRLTF